MDSKDLENNSPLDDPTTKEEAFPAERSNAQQPLSVSSGEESPAAEKAAGAPAAAAPPMNPWADPSQFPDGGAKAWLSVAGKSCPITVFLLVANTWPRRGGMSILQLRLDQLRWHISRLLYPESTKGIHGQRDCLDSRAAGLLYALLRALYWQDIRRLWATIYFNGWHVSARVWSHDGVDFYPVSLFPFHSLTITNE